MLVLRAILFALLLMIPALPAAAGGSGASVRLVVDTIAGEPALADCVVTLPAGSAVVDVLDQAVADGCLRQWSCSIVFSSPGNCFVDTIDHIVAPGLPTWWAFRVNGVFSDVGASQARVHGGETVRFTLDQGLLFF